MAEEMFSVDFDYSDLLEYDYLDLTGAIGNDGTDSIYYTAWDHAIYDDVVVDKASGKRVKASDEAGGNVTVDYNSYPSRPKPKHPHVNNVKPKTGNIYVLTFTLGGIPLVCSSVHTVY